MHLSNGWKLAAFKYRGMTHEGAQFQHILEYYRYKIKNGV